MYDMNTKEPQDKMGDSSRPADGSACNKTKIITTDGSTNPENGYIGGCPFSRSNGLKPYGSTSECVLTIHKTWR